MSGRGAGLAHKTTNTTMTGMPCLVSEGKVQWKGKQYKFTDNIRKDGHVLLYMIINSMMQSNSIRIYSLVGISAYGGGFIDLCNFRMLIFFKFR